METWLIQNWSQVITVLLLIGSWVYYIGATMGRLKNLESKVITIEDSVIDIEHAVQSHVNNNTLHLTESFSKMLDDRHRTLTADIRETKDGVKRIEQFLIGNKK